MIQGRHHNALRQVDVIANAHRTDDGAVDANTGVMTYGDITYGIVDAAIRLHNATSAQPEIAIGWGVHTYATVNLRPPAAMLVERRQQLDIPSRTGIALIHDEEVQKVLHLRTVL